MPSRKQEAYEATKRLWQQLPIGLGEDFNTILKYIEELEGSFS